MEALVNDKELREGLMVRVCTAQAVAHYALACSQTQQFQKIPDLDRISKRLQKGKGDLQVLITMYQFVMRLPALQTALKASEARQPCQLGSFALFICNTGARGQTRAAGARDVRGADGRNHYRFARDLATEFSQQTRAAELSTFEKLVENTIDLDAIDRHEYVVNPAFDPEASELTDKQMRVHRAACAAAC